MAHKDFLVVHWLQVRSLVGELRSHKAMQQPHQRSSQPRVSSMLQQIGQCCLGLLNAGKRSPEWREVSKRHAAARSLKCSESRNMAREADCGTKNEPGPTCLITGIILCIKFCSHHSAFDDCMFLEQVTLASELETIFSKYEGKQEN